MVGGKRTGDEGCANVEKHWGRGKRVIGLPLLARTVLWSIQKRRLGVLGLPNKRAWSDGSSNAESTTVCGVLNVDMAGLMELESESWGEGEEWGF